MTLDERVDSAIKSLNVLIVENWLSVSRMIDQGALGGLVGPDVAPLLQPVWQNMCHYCGPTPHKIDELCEGCGKEGSISRGPLLRVERVTA